MNIIEDNEKSYKNIIYQYHLLEQKEILSEGNEKVQIIFLNDDFKENLKTLYAVDIAKIIQKIYLVNYNTLVNKKDMISQYHFEKPIPFVIKHYLQDNYNSSDLYSKHDFEQLFLPRIIFIKFIPFLNYLIKKIDFETDKTIIYNLIIKLKSDTSYVNDIIKYIFIYLQ